MLSQKGHDGTPFCLGIHEKLSIVMMCPSHTLVIIPARNEAGSLGQIVAQSRVFFSNIWVLDDASLDGTAQVAWQAGATQVFSFPTQQGKTALLRYACEQLSPEIEWLFFLDGDGQHLPEDLERFWNCRADTDMVVGSRWGDLATMPWGRRWVNLAMSKLLSISLKGPYLDTQCGFRLVRRSALMGWHPEGKFFEFESEIYAHAVLQGWRMKTVPIAARYAAEQSKIVWPLDLCRFFLCYTRLLAKRWRAKPLESRSPAIS